MSAEPVGDVKAMHYSWHLVRMGNYFESGGTRSYAFRIEQLKKLKQVLLKYEQQIYDALYKDLKKSKEESYASELGLLLAEIKCNPEKPSPLAAAAISRN